MYALQHTDMPEEMRVEAMELCVTACEKFSTNNEVCLPELYISSLVLAEKLCLSSKTIRVMIKYMKIVSRSWNTNAAISTKYGYLDHNQ